MSNVKALDPRKVEDLFHSFENADFIIRKRYRPDLERYSICDVPDHLSNVIPSVSGNQNTIYQLGDNIQLVKVEKLVYDKKENLSDKLTTVYRTMSSYENTSVIMLIMSDGNSSDLYLGVAERIDDGAIDINARGNKLVTLKTSFEANFPGSVINEFVNEVPINKKAVIEQAFDNIRAVSCVTGIASFRNKDTKANEEFVQGMEKLFDAMYGKKFSAIFIADCKGISEIESLCASYEDIYSKLSPFAQSQQTIGKTDGVTDTESFIDGVTDTTNESVSNTLSHSHTVGKSSSKSVGVGIKSLNFSYNHTWGENESDTDTDAKTTTAGTAKSLTKQNSVATSVSTTTNDGLQINIQNRAVKTLMDRIDEQIKHLRACESFGVFDFSCYFLAQESAISKAAASVYDSLMKGEDSGVEVSAVNTWSDEDAEKAIDFLSRFYHPLVAVPNLSKPQMEKVNGKEIPTGLYEILPVTPSTIISGREISLHMGLPKKSVAGIPVIECAEFGREVVTLGEHRGDLQLGNIYHMHKDENRSVKLDKDSLTAHTFITGSTGAGKSTTIYKLLDELNNTSVGNTDEPVKFMVIEPAKGEYKNALAKNKRLGIKVYGTNPKISSLLRIDPFRFPSGKIHIYEHLDKLTEIFNVCWPMYAAMPAVLKAAIENAYRSAGWNLLKSENKHGDVFPSFIDVALEVERYINKSEYSDENKSNYKGSLLTRLESLTNGINSMIFSSDDIEDEDLFDQNVIVDLSRVGSTETKALIMGILILKLQEYRVACAEGSNSELRHVTVLEEAHNLLRRTSTEQSSETANLLGKSVEMLANSIAEMRTYGEGFIIADQSPGLLDMSVIRNTNTKIIMRLPDFSDRELVGKAAGLNDDQIVELAKLPRGVAAVYQNDWVTPVLCSVEKPKLKEGNFIEATEYPEEKGIAPLFDLLDGDFRAKLDDLTMEDSFKRSILKSSIPTESKVKLMDYLAVKKSAEGVKLLASMVFDHFKNAKSVLESTTDEATVEDLRIAIIAELEPSIIQFEDDQINLLITLILKEYADRYYIEHPLWREFAIRIGRGEIK